MSYRVATFLILIALVAFNCSAQDTRQQPTKQVAGASETSSKSTDAFTEVDETPVITLQTPPKYPEEARKAGVEGTVWVRMLVNKRGSVDSVLVSRRDGGSADMEKAALEAAKKWEFKPALLKGNPVQVWVSVPVKFKLGDKKGK